jgi:hypothetical protein
MCCQIDWIYRFDTIDKTSKLINLSAAGPDPVARPAERAEARGKRNRAGQRMEIKQPASVGDDEK